MLVPEAVLNADSLSPKNHEITSFFSLEGTEAVSSVVVITDDGWHVCVCACHGGK